MKRTIIVGIGNPVLTDDAVGLRVARELDRALSGRKDVDVKELHVGGMALMETLVGYDRAIVVDAMIGGASAGNIHRLKAGELKETRHSACAHNTSLRVALEVGRFLNMPLPGDIEIWGIEPQDMETFGEQMTDRVEQSVPGVVQEIMETLVSS